MIITTKNNNLSDDIENIILESFSKKEAILYLKKSLKNSLNKKDIDKLVEDFGSNDAASPYRLSKAVAYLKANKLLKVNDYINYFKNNKDNHIETVLLLQLLEKSPLAWQILQYSARFRP
ncbi:NTPase [Rickettsia sp. 2024-CO-Wats]|uniref:NTPase n=1 Tax=unclassified Rickettsia TaxID=114295 RepID=UPI00370D04D7